MVERAARVEPYAVHPSRPLDCVGGHERRAGDHGAAVEHLHLAQALAAAEPAARPRPAPRRARRGAARRTTRRAGFAATRRTRACSYARAVAYVREPSIAQTVR